MLLNQAMQSLLNGETLEFSIRNLASMLSENSRIFNKKIIEFFNCMYDFALIFVTVTLFAVKNK